MTPFIASSIVLFTILFSFAFGIACGYVVIAAILRAFAHRPKAAQTASAQSAIAVSASGR